MNRLTSSNSKSARGSRGISSNSNSNFNPRPMAPNPYEDPKLISPVIIYKNPDNQKESIIKDNLNKSGVYRWTNKVNGKIYIGSSINLANRLKQYYGKRLASLKNVSLIYKALLKYGHTNFTLEILEYCNKQDSIKREQYYIDLLEPEYNIFSIAGSPLGRKLSLEIKKNKNV